MKKINIKYTAYQRDFLLYIITAYSDYVLQKRRDVPSLTTVSILLDIKQYLTGSRLQRSKRLKYHEARTLYLLLKDYVRKDEPAEGELTDLIDIISQLEPHFV